ncbi:autotransporter outer membrane beta-barrel domain-containing protein [Asticcacaulis sp. EMRT-3]|uniref:autotransporter domain-containing protein n=1 Tax=Asticcacaulis sp. EMRT-3 TaxID=3040349 RepID=UPI0024AEC7FD|nr:autotransporter outer membrane beta-barrel domain-containing protein [Asticcacaulis sp. EMRT-3]MDI7774452.1 autotransporter domain-containing protein [Asticcacaulis sp. EMRT-3]
MRKTRFLTATALSHSLGLNLGLSLGLGLGLGVLATFAALPGIASAATTISTATTAPVATSATGDLDVNSSGSITLTSGTAITVDSDNAVILDGTLDLSKSTASVTGIAINAGHTGDLSIGGTISANSAFTATDSNSFKDSTGTLVSDGILDGPFADGIQRYGIHSLTGAAYTGDFAAAGTLLVTGDNSYGIRFENNIQGKFSYAGTLTMTGNNTRGIALDNGASDTVYLSGTLNYQGKDSQGVALNGDFGNNIIINGTYSGTGYASTGGTTGDTLANILKTPDDLYQDGALVTISGNVAHGVLLNVTPTIDSTNTSTDQDGDGITDSIETTTAKLTQYGSAPALLVGSAAQDISLGGLVYSANAVTPPSLNYGLWIRGSVTGSGVYQNVNGTGVQIGGLGHAVNIANAIGIGGSVVGQAYGGTATGLAMQSGASTPLLDISGALTGSASSAVTATTATNGTTTYSTPIPGSALALDIASGASLPTVQINVGGAITASATGSTSFATAIRDQSNTLTSIINNNFISAAITGTDDNGDGVVDTVLHRGIAIDTHTNTVGLTLVQTDTAPTDDTIAAPYIVGDILLGSGNDSITSNGGSILGNIDFGGGANSFTLTGKATYLGTATGTGTVALDVSDGNLGLAEGSMLNLSSLHVGGTSTIILTLNPDDPTNAILKDSGTAVFDNGALIDLTASKLILNPTSFTLLTASNINLGSMTTSTLDGQIPYLYHADLALNSTDTVLTANFRLKTQAEAQYSADQYAALVPILTAASQDPGAETSLLSQTNKAGFDQVYNQYFPDYSGENMLTLAQGAQALTQTLADLTLVPDNNAGQWWFQEHGFQTKREYGETAGFKATGFSFAGGRERQVYGNQMIGGYLSYTTATPLPTFAIANNNMNNSDLTLGAYWRINSNGFKGWLNAGAGYTQFDATRELLTPNVNHIAKAKWNGMSTSAGIGASYQYNIGSIGLRPEISADYYNLSEAKHSETGGGDYFDLNIAKRDGHLLTSQAVINVSYNRMFLKPELWVGWKENVSAQLPDTVANFTGGDPFTLSAGNIKGGGPVAGFRLTVDNRYSYFGLEGGYEKQDAYTNISLALRARFQF